MTFTISLRDDCSPGTLITNSASIIFDTEDPISTNIWSNYSALPCDAPGARIIMPGHDIRPGDVYYVVAVPSNPDDETYQTVSLFVVLEAYGEFLFFRNLTYNFDFDAYLINPFPPGQSYQEVLPMFDWPSGVGSG